MRTMRMPEGNSKHDVSCLHFIPARRYCGFLGRNSSYEISHSASYVPCSDGRNIVPTDHRKVFSIKSNDCTSSTTCILRILPTMKKVEMDRWSRYWRRMIGNITLSI